jgi:hypothetical protein
MTSILLLALAGAIIAIIIGTVWYMPNTPTGRLHMRYVGFDRLSPEEQKRVMDVEKPKMWKKYLGQTILSFLTAYAVVFIVTMSMQNGVSASLAIGFVVMNWLAFMVPVVGSNIIWGTCQPDIAWKKFFADIACNLVTVFVVAVLASYFA